MTSRVQVAEQSPTQKKLSLTVLIQIATGNNYTIAIPVQVACWYSLAVFGGAGAAGADVAVTADDGDGCRIGVVGLGDKASYLQRR
jgi:hypothetical protein